MDTIAEHLNNKAEIERLKKQLKRTGEFYAGFYEDKVYKLASKLTSMKVAYKDEIRRLSIINDKLVSRA